MKRCSLALAAALLIFAGASGCSSDDGTFVSSSKSTTTSRPGTTIAAPNGGSALGDADADAARLEALLVTNVPAGFTQLADDVGDTGPSDLAKAIRDDGAADAEQQLTAEEFFAGYQRMWSNAADDRLLIFIYQYRQTAGAAASYDRFLVSARTTQPPGTKTLALTFAGADRATGFSGAAQGATFVPLVAQVGAYLVRVTSYGSADVDHQAVAAPVMIDQIARLSS